MKTVELTDKQASVVVSALDLYLRLGLGQTWAMAEALVELHPDKKFDAWGLREKYTDAIQLDLFGFTPTSSYGISNGNVSDRTKIAFDIEQTIRGRQSLHMGSEPIPTVTST